MKTYTDFKLFQKEVLRKLGKEHARNLLSKICNKNGRNIVINGVKYSWTFKYVGSETYFTVTIN